MNLSSMTRWICIGTCCRCWNSKTWCTLVIQRLDIGYLKHSSQGLELDDALRYFLGFPPSIRFANCWMDFASSMNSRTCCFRTFNDLTNFCSTMTSKTSSPISFDGLFNCPLLPWLINLSRPLQHFNALMWCSSTRRGWIARCWPNSEVK